MSDAHASRMQARQRIPRVDKRSHGRDDDALDAADATPMGQSPDAPPDTATYDPIERRRFGPVGAVPSSRWVTVALCLGFVALLAYAISTGNTVSVVGMVVIGVFVGLPLVVLTIVNHGHFLPPPPSPYGDAAKDGMYENTDEGAEDGASPTEREPLSGQYPARLLDETRHGDGKRHGLN